SFSPFKIMTHRGAEDDENMRLLKMIFGLPQTFLDELDSFREQRLRGGRSAFVRHFWRGKHFSESGRLINKWAVLAALSVGRCLCRNYLQNTVKCYRKIDVLL